jgi:hypothetical protein
MIGTDNGTNDATTPKITGAGIVQPPGMNEGEFIAAQRFIEPELR